MGGVQGQFTHLTNSQLHSMTEFQSTAETPTIAIIEFLHATCRSPTNLSICISGGSKSFQCMFMGITHSKPDIHMTSALITCYAPVLSLRGCTLSGAWQYSCGNFFPFTPNLRLHFLNMGLYVIIIYLCLVPLLSKLTQKEKCLLIN